MIFPKLQIKYHHDFEHRKKCSTEATAPKGSFAASAYAGPTPRYGRSLLFVRPPTTTLELENDREYKIQMETR